MTKPKIKLNFADMGMDVKGGTSVYKDGLLRLINTFADIEISETPDYVICGSYGANHWKYDCVKIFYSTEDIDPDFNIFDYAIGMSDIKIYDRYFSEPQYLSYRFYDKAKNALKKHEHSDDYFLSKKKFCNFIYSNGYADKFREHSFYALDNYKHVDSAGKFLNNMGDDQIAGERFAGDWQESKIKFMQDYRFTIAYSNAQKYGYTDEKIFDAWNAGTIPVFWGDSKFCEKFNRKAYIDCCDCKTPQEVVERVKEIEESSEKYLAMQKEPIVTEGSEWYNYIQENKGESELTEFLKYIMLQSPQDAKRVSTGIGAKIYRRDIEVLSKIKPTFFYRLWRKFIVPNK